MKAHLRCRFLLDASSGPCCMPAVRHDGPVYDGTMDAKSDGESGMNCKRRGVNYENLVLVIPLLGRKNFTASKFIVFSTTEAHLLFAKSYCRKFEDVQKIYRANLKNK